MTLSHLAAAPPDVQRIAIVQAATRRATASRWSPDWRSRARPEQVPPESWRAWYVRGGRGSGKTWTGSNTLAEMAWAEPGDYGVVAPTYADMRDKCVEGPSGLLRALGTNANEVRRGSSPTVEAWNRSLGELRLTNGAVIHGDGADDGAPTIQGYNLRGLWADEVGLWKSWQKAWEESIRYAVRIAPARIVATGTPKRGHPLVRLLMADDSVHKTLLRTSDNAGNLDPAMLAELYAKYAGTTLGRQELEGEVLSDVPGALWHRDLIEVGRRQAAPAMSRVVVAIDPSATSTESADECGIVVAGIDGDQLYVLADLSLRASPSEWATIAVMAYHQWHADRIVAEVNNGGDMVGQVIANVDPSVRGARPIPYRAVTATRGKRTRAEPIHMLYEQFRAHHVGTFELLEDQMCSWNPDTDPKSPDRMDALVWAATDLTGKQDSPWAAIAGKSASAVA